jgi:spore maturation protein CgeB
LKIVLAGDWHSNVHERPMADALRRLGHDVEPFAWHSYVSADGAALPGRLLRRAQNKYLLGPLLRRVNADLISMVAAAPPDLLFVYRGTHITADTLRTIRARAPRTRIVGYNNDDPFAPGQPSWPWRHFIAAIPEYDCVLAYRAHNLRDFRDAGAKATGLLLPWFVPGLHRPAALTDADRRQYAAEAVFIGHYEPDGRDRALEALAAAGVQVRLFGPGSGYPGHDWHGPLSRLPHLKALIPVHEVWDAEYARALSAARIALCFLSKRNRDCYTRRCFEIPATGTLLMSEYTPELASIFREGEEADYFRSTDELIEKTRWYLANPQARDAVARRGHDRVHRDGHDIDSRMRRVLQDVGVPARVEQTA